ncbi:MAG TPA: hypothetical protein VFV64_09680 [Permianibacter sp.]|nr:hypothetical protein [Permianibacter sp.]
MPHPPFDTSSQPATRVELIAMHAINSRECSGNPAGVVLAGAALSHEQKQAIVAMRPSRHFRGGVIAASSPQERPEKKNR